MSRPESESNQHDLRFTVAVVIAAALARDEQQHARPAGDPSREAGTPDSGALNAGRFAGTGSPGRSYQFTLLAASARQERVWP